MRAKYTSVFDGTIVCESDCEYDPTTKTVTNILPAENSEDADSADALTDEYITLSDGTVLRGSDGVTFI